MMAPAPPPPFIEDIAAFSSEEQQRALSLFEEFFEKDQESFTPLTAQQLAGNASAAGELEWLTSKMLGLAAKADADAGWGTAAGCHADAKLQLSDELIYDRFGPSCAHHFIEQPLGSLYWPCSFCIRRRQNRGSSISYSTRSLY
jgi:hypothetical protein